MRPVRAVKCPLSSSARPTFTQSRARLSAQRRARHGVSSAYVKSSPHRRHPVLCSSKATSALYIRVRSVPQTNARCCSRPEGRRGPRPVAAAPARPPFGSVPFARSNRHPVAPDTRMVPFGSAPRSVPVQETCRTVLPIRMSASG